MLQSLFAALVVLPLFPSVLSAQASTLMVDDDGAAAVANCGGSTAAYSTAGAAIAAASDGDTVLVCPGTYFENITFSGKAIVVKSVAGPAVTILDGNEAGTVVTFPRDEGAAVLEGFTIRNGTASSGGGIQIGEASPTIRRNTIVGNRACEGAGIAIFFASPLVEDNTIAQNTSNCFGSGGGGIAVIGSGAAVIRRNTITGNVSPEGGGISMAAAGTPTIQLNVITGNSAREGGGLRLSNHSDAIISGNLIAGNDATSSGGGIYWLVPNGTRGPLVVGNTIADNTSPSGSGIFADGFDAGTVLTNNIIAAASAQTAVFCGGFNDANPPVFRFNNVFSPTAAAYGGICHNPTGTDGNISSDPLFEDRSAGNYHLGVDSPCIDVGNNAAAGATSTDLDGYQRVLDGNSDGVFVVDIGADEAAARIRHVQIDAPAGGAINAAFVVSGWATDGRGLGTGVDVVDVWAHRADGSGSTFLGSAEYGLPRGDVAAALLDPRYTNSGFRLGVQGRLSAGTYWVVAYARSTSTGTFDTTGRVRVTISSTPLMTVDTPASGAAIQGPLRLSGWAIDYASGTGTGVDTIHIHALPADGRPGFFLGAAAYGLARPDVGAAFGASRFSPSGWALEATLPRGEYQLLVHARSTVAQAFNRVIVLTVIIVATEPYLFIDTPARGTVLDQPIFISGWALDLGAPSGTGVDAVHAYAFPNPGSGQPPVFLGVAIYGTTRPDVAAAFGRVQFTNSGYLIPVNGLQPGSYLLAVYAHSTVSNTFNAVRTVWVTIVAPP